MNMQQTCLIKHQVENSLSYVVVWNDLKARSKLWRGGIWKNTKKSKSWNLEMDNLWRKNKGRTIDIGIEGKDKAGNVLHSCPNHRIERKKSRDSWRGRECKPDAKAGEGRETIAIEKEKGIFRFGEFFKERSRSFSFWVGEGGLTGFVSWGVGQKIHSPKRAFSKLDAPPPYYVGQPLLSNINSSYDMQFINHSTLFFPKMNQNGPKSKNYFL